MISRQLSYLFVVWFFIEMKLKTLCFFRVSKSFRIINTNIFTVFKETYIETLYLVAIYTFRIIINSNSKDFIWEIELNTSQMRSFNCIANLVEPNPLLIVQLIFFHFGKSFIIRKSEISAITTAALVVE